MGNYKKLMFGALASVSLMVVAGEAQAIDPTLDTGRFVDSRIKEAPKTKITDDLLIKDSSEQGDVSNADKIIFKLNSVKIEGNSVFTNGEIEAMYEDKLGSEVSLADIYALRDEITKLYRKEGYVLSRAVIPAQRVKGGDVKIQIVEGYLNNISIEGDLSDNDQDIINNYVAKMKQEGPLNSNNLERYLLLMNDLHGLSANGVLRPATSGTGAADFIIVLGNDFYDGIVTFDNSGTKFVGEYLISAEAAVNSAFGMNERIAVRTIHDADFRELAFGDLTYEQPIGYEGTNLRVNIGDSETDPTVATGADINGESFVAEIEVTHPFIRSRRENLTGRAQFAFKNTRTDVGAVNNFYDKTRVIEVGATYDVADDTGAINLIDFAVHQGLEVLSAGDNGNRAHSRTNAGPNFKNSLQNLADNSLCGRIWAYSSLLRDSIL